MNNDKITRQDLIQLTAKLKADFLRAVNNLDFSRLVEQRRIQGSEVTLMSAVFRALTHLEGHVGQIILLTRIQLDDRYKIFWVPQTDEQRAERKYKH